MHTNFRRAWLSVLGLTLGLYAAQPAMCQTLAQVEQELIRICQQVRPSVVCITTSREWPAASGGRHSTSYSGVVLDNQGHIVTVAAAVANADGIEVTSVDGKRFSAKLIGVDERSDTAVVKVEEAELAPASLGTAKGMQVGSFIITIGNPFGLGGSACTGIVSGTDRCIETGDYPLYGMLQITPPTNPGDAGGAVLNSQGELIGVIHSTFGRGPSFSGMRNALQFLITPQLDARSITLEGRIAAEGINFAMPIDRVKRIADQLIRNGRVKRGWLGVAIRSINGATPAEERQNAPHGVVVVKVIRNSPASKVGIEPGDVITHIDSRKILGVRELVENIPLTEVDTIIELNIIHEGKVITHRVVIEEEPEHPEKYVRRIEELSFLLESGLAGADVQEMTPFIRERFQVEEGVFIAEVVPGSPADHAGIWPGDIIIHFGGNRIRNRSHLMAAIRISLEQPVRHEEFTIEIHRNGRKIILVWK